VKTLIKDPLSIIVIGVAGQGNVVTSSLICNALLNEGFKVTFGQSYPAQQRGGSVINYIRVSKDYQCSPIIPQGGADIIVGMEPVEALRMLAQYGNPDVITVVNPRPIISIEIAGQSGKYPNIDKLMDDISSVSSKMISVNTTDEAQNLGNSIMSNVVLVGVLVGSGLLPLDRESMVPVIQERFPKVFDINMKAFDRGMELGA